MTRIKKTILPFLISISCLAVIDSVAQQRKMEIKPDQYRAVNWTVQDGLSAYNMHAMIKDSKGFLWIGSTSQGGELCRFDGARFKKYFPDPQKSGTINSDYIQSFEEDSLHNIWIGTGKGISRYDIKADSFTNFLPLIDTGSSLKTVVPFWATKDEVFCMEPERWITTFNIHTLARKKMIQLSKKDDPEIQWNTNKSFFDAESKSIWVLRRYEQNRGGLEQIFLDGKIQYYSWPCYRKNVKHPRHDAEDMVFDPKKNSIWINSGDGLLEFSLNDKQFRPVDALKELIKFKDYDRGVGIDIDAKGRVWSSTFSNGIFIYDPETEQVRTPLSDTSLQKLAGEANLRLYCDRDGIVWTSKWNLNGGVYELLPYNPSAKRYAADPKLPGSLSNKNIENILPGPMGKMWIGTADGLNIFDPETEKFETLREKDLPGIKGSMIAPVYIDTVRQKVWLGAMIEKGTERVVTIYEMNLETRECRPIIFRDRSRQFDKTFFYGEQVRPYKNGLLICDFEQGLFEVKENSMFADLVFPFKSIGWRMILNEDRFLFLRGYGTVADHNVSFENINGKWIKIPYLLDTLKWNNIVYDKKDQSQWVSFRYELVHYDKDFHKIRSYTENDGYVGSAFNMMFDNAGYIWFDAGMDQLCRLDTASGIITTLTEADGYEKQTYGEGSSTAKDARGNLYFGAWGESSNVGLGRIYPERYSSAAALYLRSLDVNQKPFSLSIGLNNLEELSLNYDQNNINIETGIIDYYAKGKGHIRYKLEEDGKFVNWQYGSAYYTIRYAGLQPGKYKLTLQASNVGNEFNGPIKILMIKISPPFWQTWWFRTLMGVIIIAIIYVIIQYRSRSLKQRNKELEEKVLHRTKELKHSLEGLKATQSQLIQSEKMASLGELTAGIAHEIQNPLNFVNNFSDVNKELLIEMNDEIDKGNLSEVKLIAKDIIDNEEKINHHGKRADAIVKGMLQHSRSSSGVKEPTDINALADEYLRLAYHGLRAKDKSFNAMMKTDLDETIGNIKIVPQDIGRVILNLITNAFYTVAEKKSAYAKSSMDNNYEPTVTVGTKKINGTIEIIVKDNGNGIPPKVLDKIFQPFFTTKPTGQGTGLGLSLSYDIVKAHGGELKVGTKDGEGSAFTIVLPAN
jgi:signal transduction histidine kinase/ligand-binding sensor domain-containing protein